MRPTTARNNRRRCGCEGHLEQPVNLGVKDTGTRFNTELGANAEAIPAEQPESTRGIRAIHDAVAHEVKEQDTNAKVGEVLEHDVDGIVDRAHARLEGCETRLHEKYQYRADQQASCCRSSKTPWRR